MRRDRKRALHPCNELQSGKWMFGELENAQAAERDEDENLRYRK